MKLTAKIKLLTTPDQERLLLQTLEVANAACNAISAQAWDHRTFRQFSLHKLTYYAIREQFPLTPQIVVRCIAKVADAYKLDHHTLRTFRPHGAIAYDQRILAFSLTQSTVSIWTIAGRQTIPFMAGQPQRDLLAGQRGESDLCWSGRKFFLCVSCEVETPAPQAGQDFLGIDLGIVNLAADSDGAQFSGKTVEQARRKYAHRRCNLQHKGTKAAKRKLKRLAGKQARFQKQINHVISKRIVQKAQDTGRRIALEELGGIRERVTVRRHQRARQANWAFAQLRQFITYKAGREGIPVVLVDPRYTSQTCPECGHVAKANRPN